MERSKRAKVVFWEPDIGGYGMFAGLTSVVELEVCVGMRYILLNIILS